MIWHYVGDKALLEPTITKFTVTHVHHSWGDLMHDNICEQSDYNQL